MARQTLNRIKRVTALLLCIIIAAALLAPVTVHAHNNPKTVRVGWYESAFNTMDSSGRRSGYAYEYQMKIAAYAGWEYTYITASWPELMEMLLDGRIDMLSDVSYTEERAEKMLFPELSMGTEEYCIFITPENTDITAADYSTLNGKRVGVNAGTIQADLYRSWAEKNHIDAELTELTGEEEESMAMLNSGRLDAYVSLNAYADPEKLVPVCRIGSSDFYFAVNKDRPDLLSDLNASMNRIQDENPYYNQQMFEKYIQRFGSNAFLSTTEEAWLNGHGTIRAGYLDNYLAFCAKDPETGELTGALKEYLKNAADCIKEAHLDFEPRAYATSEAAYEALTNGEIDCVFPASLSCYDAEKKSVILTPAVMHSDAYAVVRQEDRESFGTKDHIIVAVNEGNANYAAFLEQYFPDWRAVYFPTTADCLKAVSDGLADCVIISSFRYNNIARMCKKYRLSTYDAGITMDFCFAVDENETALYSILSKTVGLVPSSTVNADISYYISEDAKLSFIDYFSDNIAFFMAVMLVVVLVILFLLIRSIRSVRKAHKLIAVTETDSLTGLYNRDYFFEYADRMYRDHPDVPKDAIVLNIEQFHSINALNGRAFGDQVLQVLGNEIHLIAGEFDGIGGRFGADRFDIYCRHIKDYQAVFERLKNKLSFLATNVSIRLRMGVMPWQEGVEPIQLFDRARTACNMARGHYKEHLIIFNEKVLEQELYDQRLLNDLRRALDSAEFEVYYQPKFDIRGEKPQLAGAEALIRWQHPEMGLISPGRFIPLFERYGLITDVDQYVWAQAAKQIARWKAETGILLPVSVNLSRVDVFGAELESTLDGILMREGLPHNVLELEITESAYTEDADQLIRVVKALHRKGYTIEMDDFGTGYSSLNMLSAMPIDVLKMDRSFIVNIEKNKKDVQMVSLILGIAGNLGMPVIAEGAETEAQVAMLKELGCTYIQGYFFSRPIPPSEFEEKYLLPNPNDEGK